MNCLAEELSNSMDNKRKNISTSFKKGALIAFGELFLKSDSVKKFFKKKLDNDLSYFLKREGISFGLYQSRERFFIQTDQANEALKIIGKISGISWFSECFYFPKTNLSKFALFIDKKYPDFIKKGETFAIRLSLAKGVIKESSKKIIERVAKNIERKVDLDNPKSEIFIEIRKDGWFLYLNKEKGAGGFPAGSAGKVLALTSGGIDSPVASYLIAKKGAENIWLHFHSFPLVSNKSIEKVKELAKVFLGYQARVTVYFVPFSKAQVEIRANAPAGFRILLYRRLMLKIAEIIAEKENCKALVTGESLGQVSSQTLPNLKVIEHAVKIPIFRPLIALDKREITDMAKHIGTFDISIKPQEDCCTLFTPKHANANGKIEQVLALEKKINVKKMIREALSSARVEKF